MSTRRTLNRRAPKGHCRFCLKPVKPPRRTFCDDSCVHEFRLQSDPGYLRDKTLERDKGICGECGFDIIGADNFFAKVWGETKRELADREELAIQRTWPEVFPGHPYDPQLIDTPAFTPKYERLMRENPWFTTKLMRELFYHTVTPWDLTNAWTQADQSAYFTVMGTSRGKHTWEADHIKEVVRGGGASWDANPLDNIQTLCLACHKAKTARLARERAAERKIK